MSEPDPDLSPRPRELPWLGSGYGSRGDVGKHFRGPLLFAGAFMVVIVLVTLALSSL